MSKRTFTKQASVNRNDALKKGDTTFEGSKCSFCGGKMRYTSNNACIECYYPNAQPKDFEKRKKILIDKVKAQAKMKGIEFDISVKDIEWSETCPILFCEIDYYTTVTKTGNTASFDRKNPSKGYIRGNVFVISNKANSMKSNGTVEIFERLLQYVKN